MNFYQYTKTVINNFMVINNPQTDFIIIHLYKNFIYICINIKYDNYDDNKIFFQRFNTNSKSIFILYFNDIYL